jgi:pimeloyl-ACP methyl ester carboxylesterase
MNSVTKQFIALFSIVVIISTSNNFAALPTIGFDVSKLNLTALAEQLTIAASDLNKSDNGCHCKPSSDDKDRDFKSGLVTVALDNNNEPVNVSYVKKGKKKDQNGNKRTIFVFVDSYFGKGGWKCVMDKLSEYFYTIAIDPVGSGESSKPEPTALDGVGGEFGYSYAQNAFFLHEFIAHFNFEGPIVFVGVDPEAKPGLIYADRYANDPCCAFSKMVLVNSSFQPIISDDPCQLAFLNSEAAAFFDQLYQQDPCTALCVLYGTGSFAEPGCPAAAHQYLQDAINYGATLPKSVWTRTINFTGREDVSQLMATITIPVLYIYSVVDNTSLLFRQAAAIAFSGFCGACNAAECPVEFVAPFPNCQFVSLNEKGTVPHLTDQKRFIRLVRDFATGCDIECCVCDQSLDIPVICQEC